MQILLVIFWKSTRMDILQIQMFYVIRTSSSTSFLIWHATNFKQTPLQRVIMPEQVLDLIWRTIKQILASILYYTELL